MPPLRVVGRDIGIDGIIVRLNTLPRLSRMVTDIACFVFARRPSIVQTRYRKFCFCIRNRHGHQKHFTDRNQRFLFGRNIFPIQIFVNLRLRIRDIYENILILVPRRTCGLVFHIYYFSEVFTPVRIFRNYFIMRLLPYFFLRRVMRKE